MKALNFIFCAGLLCLEAEVALAAGQQTVADALLESHSAEIYKGAHWNPNLGDYRESNTPVYFGACLATRYDHDIRGRRANPKYGKIIMYFPAHATEGSMDSMAADRRGRPMVVRDSSGFMFFNGARVRIKSQVEISEVGQGGSPEGAAFKAAAEYLLRNRLLKLVQPKDFAAAINAPTRSPCPSDEEIYDYRDLDKYYKDHGWTGPTPLPGR